MQLCKKKLLVSRLSSVVFFIIILSAIFLFLYFELISTQNISMTMYWFSANSFTTLQLSKQNCFRNVSRPPVVIEIQFR